MWIVWLTCRRIHSQRGGSGRRVIRRLRVYHGRCISSRRWRIVYSRWMYRWRIYSRGVVDRRSIYSRWIVDRNMYSRWIVDRPSVSGWGLGRGVHDGALVIDYVELSTSIGVASVWRAALPVGVMRLVVGRAIVKPRVAQRESGCRNGKDDKVGTTKDRHDSVIVERNVDAVWAYSVDVAVYVR